jgi:hypothetical protein
MQINVAELHQITDKIFAHLHEIDVESIELTEDFYWHIPEEQLYNLDSDPAQLGLGQLYDDWADLRRLLEEGNDPIAYDLVDLAAILRYIGERVVS